jgi:hypothetical protein
MLVELLLDQIKVNDLICFMREKPLALKARGFFGILNLKNYLLRIYFAA